MRQFALLLCVFSFSAALADHDGSKGYDYNGRTFQCDDYNKAEDFANTEGGGHSLTISLSASCIVVILIQVLTL